MSSRGFASSTRKSASFPAASVPTFASYELLVNIQGGREYLWRAVDQDGDVIDILVQSRRDRRAAERFFRKLLKRQGREPRRLITDKLRSYSAAHRAVMPSVVHSTERSENNRRKFSSADSARTVSRPPLAGLDR